MLVWIIWSCSHLSIGSLDWAGYFIKNNFVIIIHTFILLKLLHDGNNFFLYTTYKSFEVSTKLITHPPPPPPPPQIISHANLVIVETEIIIITVYYRLLITV